MIFSIFQGVVHFLGSSVSNFAEAQASSDSNPPPQNRRVTDPVWVWSCIQGDTTMTVLGLLGRKLEYISISLYHSHSESFKLYMIWIHMNSCSSSILPWLRNVAFISSDDFKICACGCASYLQEVFFVLALFDSYYFTQVLRSFLCHRTMWKQVSNLCRTPYVCCLRSDRQDVYIDNVQCQAGPSALIPALTRPLTRPVLTFVLVTKPQEKDSLQRCLRMPKDLYCQLDIFLRIFLWLRYRWYKSGIHGRCWGAATCLRNSCLDVFHCRSFYQSSIASLYPLNMAILLFSSYVSLPSHFALAGSYRKWQAVATQCSHIQPAVIEIHQSRVSVWPAPLLSRPGVPFTPEQLEQKKIEWKWASSETSTESQFWLIHLTLRGSWEQCEDDFKLKACAHATYVTDHHRSTDPSKDMDRMGWISLGSLKSWSKVSTHDAKAGWDSNPSAHAEPCRGARAPDQRRDFWQLRHASQHENLVFLNFLILVFRKTCILWLGSTASLLTRAVDPATCFWALVARHHIFWDETWDCHLLRDSNDCYKGEEFFAGWGCPSGFERICGLLWPLRFFPFNDDNSSSRFLRDLHSLAISQSGSIRHNFVSAWGRATRTAACQAQLASS